MNYYRTCPDCGANLNNGKLCDCTRQECPECGTLYINHTGHIYTQCPRCHAAMDKETAAPGATNTENSQTHEAPIQAEPASMPDVELPELLDSLSPENQRRLQRFCILLAHSPDFQKCYDEAGGFQVLGGEGVNQLINEWAAKGDELLKKREEAERVVTHG